MVDGLLIGHCNFDAFPSSLVTQNVLAPWVVYVDVRVYKYASMQSARRWAGAPGSGIGMSYLRARTLGSQPCARPWAAVACAPCARGSVGLSDLRVSGVGGGGLPGPPRLCHEQRNTAQGGHEQRALEGICDAFLDCERPRPTSVNYEGSPDPTGWSARGKRSKRSKRRRSPSILGRFSVYCGRHPEENHRTCVHTQLGPRCSLRSLVCLDTPESRPRPRSLPHFDPL